MTLLKNAGASLPPRIQSLTCAPQYLLREVTDTAPHAPRSAAPQLVAGVLEPGADWQPPTVMEVCQLIASQVGGFVW